MRTEAFDTILAAYLAWRTKAAAVLGRPIPSEVTALVYEQQRLEPLRFEAEDWRAEGVRLYYAKKARTIEALWSEVAKTALHDVAKAQSHRELWLRESADGVCEAVKSRQFTVKAEIKRMGAA